MKRSEFWKWLDTCPTHKWDILEDDVGHCRILFPIAEDPEEEDEKKKSIGEIMSLKYKMEAKKN